MSCLSYHTSQFKWVNLNWSHCFNHIKLVAAQHTTHNTPITFYLSHHKAHHTHGPIKLVTSHPLHDIIHIIPVTSHWSSQSNHITQDVSNQSCDSHQTGNFTLVTSMSKASASTASLCNHQSLVPDSSHNSATSAGVQEFARRPVGHWWDTRQWVHLLQCSMSCLKPFYLKALITFLNVSLKGQHS